MAANQNVTQLTQQTGSADPTSLFYAVTGGATDTGLPLSVFVHNLGLTGTPTTPTASVNTNTTQIASTAYVMAQIASYGYAPLASPTFTGTVTIPSGASISGYLTTASAASTYAPLASPTFTGTVTIPTVTLSGGSINNTTIGATTANTGKFTTLQATGLISPSTTVGIAGTTAADNAQAGSVGETIVSQITTNTAWAPANGVPGNLTSITLTAGDWDVFGSVWWAALAGSCTWVLVEAGCTTSSATLPPAWSMAVQAQATASAQLAGGPTPTLRLNVNTSTTVYLVGQVNYTGGTMNYQCQLMARRRR